MKQNGTTYCDLTIARGATVSDVVNGFGLPPLQAKAELSVDVSSVPQDPQCSPDAM